MTILCLLCYKITGDQDWVEVMIIMCLLGLG